MFKQLRNVLFAPVDAPAATGGELSKDAMIDFMALDDKADDKEEVLELPKTPKEVKEPKESDEDSEETKEEDDEKEEEVDELKEIEEELEEPTEEQLELVTPARRRDILKKFPTLFKDFPYLERAYYREQAFTQLLPTIDDAKIAVEKASTLDNFEKDLMSGNTERILKSIHQESPEAFAKIADDYLGTLSRVDKEAYHHVLGNTIKHTIVAMAQEAKRSNNEQLQEAASLLNQFVFGVSEFQPPVNLAKEDPNKGKVDEVQERERKFREERFTTTHSELNTRIGNAIKATVDGNIDPNSSMTDFVKKNASREAIEQLSKLINTDTRFKTLLDKLWDKSFQDNFSNASVERIRAAYLSKAKTLLPAVIKSARNEALKGLTRKVKAEKEEQEEETTRKSPSNNENRRPAASTNGGKIRSASDIPKGMKSIDFLMQD